MDKNRPEEKVAIKTTLFDPIIAPLQMSPIWKETSANLDGHWQ